MVSKRKISDVKFGCHIVCILLRRVSAAVSDHRISNRHWEPAVLTATNTTSNLPTPQRALT